jgi:hypothetical protein
MDNYLNLMKKWNVVTTTNNSTTIFHENFFYEFKYILTIGLILMLIQMYINIKQIEKEEKHIQKEKENKKI